MKNNILQLLTLLVILFLIQIKASSLDSNVSIYNQKHQKLYPFLKASQSFCEVQNSRIQFTNTQVYKIASQRNPFFVILQPQDQIDVVILTGISKSIKNNQTGQHEALIFVTAMCGTKNQGSSSLSFNAKFTLTYQQKLKNSQSFQKNNQIQNKNESQKKIKQKEDEQILSINAIIYCAPLFYIRFIENILNQIILISILMINVFVEMPTITRFTYAFRSFIILLFFISMIVLPRFSKFLSNLVLLMIFYFLGSFGVARDIFVQQNNMNKNMYKCIWILFIFIQLNYLCFLLLKINVNFLTYIFQYNSFQMAFVIISQLFYVTRLRGAVYLLSLIYFIQYLPNIQVFSMALPTFFDTNCKINHLLFISLIMPIMQYFRKILEPGMIFSIFISIFAINQMLEPNFKIKYWIIIVIFFLWVLAQIKIKGAFQVIKYRR